MKFIRKGAPLKPSKFGKVYAGLRYGSPAGSSKVLQHCDAQKVGKGIFWCPKERD